MHKHIDRRKTKTAVNEIAKATSRRRFLKRGAVAAAGVTLAFPQISRAQTIPAGLANELPCARSTKYLPEIVDCR